MNSGSCSQISSSCNCPIGEKRNSEPFHHPLWLMPTPQAWRKNIHVPKENAFNAGCFKIGNLNGFIVLLQGASEHEWSINALRFSISAILVWLRIA